MTNRCIASVRRALAVAETAASPIVLVDNGSHPARPDATVRLETNLGFAAGMNAGLRAAFEDPACDLAAALSNDVEVPPEFFEALSHLPRRDEPSVLCPHVYFLADRQKRSYTHGSLNEADWTLSHHFDPDVRQLVYPLYYPAAATLWTRSAFELLGGFDERYFCYWEDVDLSRRAARAAVTLRSCPTLKVHHLGRGTTGTRRSYSRHFEAGRQLAMEIASRAD